jgi:hypothetical protein
MLSVLGSIPLDVISASSIAEKAEDKNGGPAQMKKPAPTQLSLHLASGPCQAGPARARSGSCFRRCGPTRHEIEMGRAMPARRA